MAVEESGYLVRAITRAAEILDLIQHNGGPASLKVLTHESGLSKPTVLRMLRNLEHIGLVERVPGTDAYRLGLRCVELGQAYLEQVDFRREALPILERLRDRYNETVHLAVLDEGLRVIYLEKLEGKHAIGIMMSRVGLSAPAHCTGLGKALLSEYPGDPVDILNRRGELTRKTANTISEADQLRAELAAIRERGYALDLEEHEEGVRCVAATIHGSDGSVLGALSIAGPAQRLPEEQLVGELADATVTAAREVTERLGGRREAEAS
jgi:DNA-binding IclR family transcriptional regulator